MIGKSINEIEIGDCDCFKKTLSESDVYLFAGITGDFNPAHLNAHEAKNTKFKRRIAHGILTAGLISAVFGTKLPGPGTIYLEQYLSFKKPVYFGDTITAQVKVLEKNLEKNLLVCETICVNQDNEIVLSGKATVMPPKSKGF